ncbi:MAG: hypothetical protein KF716_19395 [Anaerolineae bacterium]|nr:hypothetical protein [Anaerolineae bacterium]
MTSDTLYSTQQGIARYSAVFKETQGAFNPPLALSALDGYLMQQLAALYPLPPTILDLAAQDTLGASTVLWASTADRIQGCVARLAPVQPPTPDLCRLLPDLLDLLTIDRRLLTLTESPADDLDVWWRMVQPQINITSPLFIVAPISLVQHLSELAVWHPSPVIFLLGLGLSGESAALESVYAACSQQPDLQLILPRDGRAFWAASRLGLIARRDNQHLHPVLTRIAALFEGNFDFINLLESNLLLRQRYQQLLIDHERKLAEREQGHSTPPESPPAVPITFDDLPVMGDLHSVWDVRDWLARIQWSVRYRLGLPKATVQHPDYRVEYLEVVVPSQMQPAHTYRGAVSIRNMSTQVWHAAGTHPQPVNISYHWLDQDTAMHLKEGKRTVLQDSIGRGYAAHVAFEVDAPAQPGHFLFELDLVHEGVTWFNETGQPAIRLPVQVLDP